MTNKWLVKIVVSLFVAMGLLSGCGQSKATDTKDTDPWKNADGSYIQEGSSQYNNGKMQLKLMENNCVLYNFDVMQGSEKEDIADEFNVAGTFLINKDGSGESSIFIGKKEIKLGFKKNGKKVTVTQDGELVLPVKGTYEFSEKELQVSENAAVEILESLAPVTTSLNESNRPYTLEYTDDSDYEHFYEVKAINDKSKTMFARFLIADDLSCVYRQDDTKEEPTLIFGKARNLDGVSAGKGKPKTE